MYTTQDMIMRFWRSLPRLSCVCNFYSYIVVIWNRLPTEMRASVGLVTFSSWFLELVCGLLWSVYLNRCLFIGNTYPELHTCWTLPILGGHLKICLLNLTRTPTFECCITSFSISCWSGRASVCIRKYSLIKAPSVSIWMEVVIGINTLYGTQFFLAHLLFPSHDSKWILAFGWRMLCS